MNRVHDYSVGAERVSACIFSVSGLHLTHQEKKLFKEANPFGFILFGRNIECPNQTEQLVRDLKECVGRDCPILIDQEGGRVQRLKPPHWRLYRPMQYYGEYFEDEQEAATFKLKKDTDRLCTDLIDLGVNVNCAPVLDVLNEVTHDVIGDRAFSSDPDIVVKLGLLVAERYLFNGITPVIKHIPGHGRAAADSHLELPVVDTPLSELEETDFYPFAMISHTKHSRSMWAMTAHVVYSDIDPDHPASVSEEVISKVMRAHIGFEGILLSDDLDMKALDAYGDAGEKCLKVLQAGCDLGLYCSGDIDAMQKIADVCPKISADTLKRLQNAVKVWESAA